MLTIDVSRDAVAGLEHTWIHYKHCLHSRDVFSALARYGIHKGAYLGRLLGCWHFCIEISTPSGLTHHATYLRLLSL